MVPGTKVAPFPYLMWGVVFSLILLQLGPVIKNTLLVFLSK
jgi:hypothetical protein